MLHLWLHRGQNRELDRSNNPKRCGFAAQTTATTDMLGGATDASAAAADAAAAAETVEQERDDVQAQLLLSNRALRFLSQSTLLHMLWSI